MRCAWPVVAGMVASVLATSLGCSRSAEQPGDAAPRAVASRPAVADEPVALSKMPVPEFQQPPTLPATEPLPKLPPEPSENSASPLAAGTTKWSRPEVRGAGPPARSGEPTPVNPLRDGNPPVAEQSARETPKEKTLPSASKSSTPETTSPTSPPPGRPKTAKNSEVPFDPIKENGSIFIDNGRPWPKPKLAMIITGMEHGYLEPCGCAGLDRMKGGMGRRATLFKELREKGWPVVGLDVGGLVQGFGRQAELKFQTAVEGKRKMVYDCIAFGTDDLRLPAGELVAVAAGIDGKPSPFVAANVGLFGFAADITPKSRVIEAGGIKIGVTAVLGKAYQREIRNDEIEMTDPETALKKIVPELKQKASYLVLLAHATMKESEDLGKKFPEFNVVVVSDGQPEPPRLPETIPGMKTLLISVGYKGMNAIVLGLFDDPRDPVRYQRVPLDSRFASSPDMKMLMTAYQEQVKTIGFSGLGLRPVPHPLAEPNGDYIGTKKCAESCHEISYDIWKKTRHREAYETLVKLDPPRNFDPECVSCHVTGWHPTKFFPYKGGYQSEKKTPELLDVGCEDCHGPGGKHADVELAGSEELKVKLRKTVVVTKEEAKKRLCVSCHDIDNSPDFDFDK